MATIGRLEYGQLNTAAKQIRLIVLGSISSRDIQEVEPVSCEIITASLNDSPKYEALSYTWGDASLRGKIFVDGILISVTANLAEALRDIRYIEVAQNTRLLWVDAICINQNDEKERNEQVRLMGDIYRQAEQVLSWLGPFASDLGISQDPESLHINAFFEDSHKVFSLDGITSDDAIKKSWAAMYVNGPESEALWDLLACICEQNYWARLWIVQEVGLAKKLKIFYKHSNMSYWIDWESFPPLCKWMPDFFRTYGTSEWIDRIGVRLSTTLPVRLSWEVEGPDQRLKLRQLMETTEKSRCVDARDKIYGLLGLSSDVDDKENITIDYSKSLFEVYRDVLWFQQRSAELPDIGRHNRVRSNTIRFSQLVQRSLGGPIPVNGGCQSFIYRSHHPPVVCCEGGITGPITLLDIFEDNPTSPCLAGPERISAIASYFTLDSVGATIGVTNKWIESALGRLEKQHFVYGKRIRSLNCPFSYATRVPVPYILPSTNENPLGEDHGKDHRLFLEANGNIGLAPSNIRNGDLLCQFMNCDIGVIIRPFRDRFSIVGRAVVALRQDEEERTFSNANQEKFYSSCKSIYSGPSVSLIDVVYFYLDPISLQDLTCPVSGGLT